MLPARLNLAQAFNSVGTVFGPYVIGPMILAGTVLGAAELAKLPAVQQAAYQAAQAKLVEGPYAVLAVVLVVLAVAIWLFRLPPLEAKEEQSAAKDEHSFFDALRHSHVFLGVIAIFLYVGAEVSIGSFLVNYIALPDIGHMSEHDATKYVALYWGGAMIGRFVGAALLKFLDPRKVLGFFAIIASLLVITTMSTHGNVAVTTVVAIGLFNSVMFPTIFTLGIDKMGPLAGKASSLLIMGIVGGALVPLAQGALADHIGVQHAFVLPLLCYLYIMFYGFKGSKVA